MSGSARTRCAIYTRKSSDEGLEQSFNSLDAQREACAAYVLSQAGEGWSAVSERYDDGGLSGGTLERPALQRLLADVDAGRIDLVVVYKVDRLTRSLLDFSRLVERFDAAGVSFVSVTQAFNTTTSMGRLTLNMLLSFAQFEREVTAERIRDKIAASKAKGMWMGGTPPLGYEPDGRTLAVVEEHAGLVRHLFERYLALGSVRLLEEELRREGTTLPVRTRRDGSRFGGAAFTRGQLYHLLRNVTYIGRIGHKDTTYPGQHQPIVEAATFAAVQAMLADHVQGQRSRVRAESPSLLAGRIFDEAGEPLVASHASRPVSSAVERTGRDGGKRRYRYYLSRALNEGISRTGLRLPAREIETLVTGRVAQLLADPLALAAAARLDVRPEQVEALHWRCKELEAQLHGRGSPALLALVARVEVGAAGVTLTCDTAALAAALGAARHADAPATLTLTTAATLTRSGRALRLVQDDGALPGAAPDRSLVRLLVKARAWWAVLRSGAVSPTELAHREGVTRPYVARVVRLAFLSPAVTQAILAGRQRAGVTVASLTVAATIPLSWREQEAAMLPGRA